MTAVTTHSTAQTEEAAAALSPYLKDGDVLLLHGGLGAGKTAFVRGLVRGLGGDENEVSSPTFALVHQYGNGSRALYHFDMYRVETFDDLYSTGFFDYLDYGGILAIEWSENIEAVLPENTITVEIRKVEADPDAREILIFTPSERGFSS